MPQKFSFSKFLKLNSRNSTNITFPPPSIFFYQLFDFFKLWGSHNYQFPYKHESMFRPEGRKSNNNYTISLLFARSENIRNNWFCSGTRGLIHGKHLTFNKHKQIFFLYNFFFRTFFSSATFLYLVCQ